MSTKIHPFPSHVHHIDKCIHIIHSDVLGVSHVLDNPLILR